MAVGVHGFKNYWAFVLAHLLLVLGNLYSLGRIGFC